MKNKYLLSLSLILGLSNYNAQGVGINIENPQSALDVKIHAINGSNDKVLRATTIPSTLKVKEESFFLVGETANEGFDTRAFNYNEVIDLLKKKVNKPRTIALLNTENQTFTGAQNQPQNTQIPLKNLLFNDSKTSFEYLDSGEVKILEEGYYEVAADFRFDIFPEIQGNSSLNKNNSFVVGVGKRSKDIPTSDPKAISIRKTLVSRSDESLNKTFYEAGKTLNFVYKFNPGDIIFLTVNALSYSNIATSEGKISLTINKIEQK